MSALSSEILPKYWKSYFREYSRGAVHNQLLELFDAWKSAGNNRAGLAKKLERRPEQITRWLAAPSNLEIDTITDLALAMGRVPKVTFESVEDLFKPHSGMAELEVQPDETGFIIGKRAVTGSSSGAFSGL